MPSFTDPPSGGKGPIRPAHLTLVHPAPPAAPPKPDTTPRTRSGRRVPYQNDLFTPDVEQRLRAAIRTAASMFGTLACLADAMRVPRAAVKEAVRGRQRVSGAMAICLARALGIPLEALVRGLVVVPKVCPHCGATRRP